MKRRLIHALQKYVLNPPIKLLFALGIVPPGYALLETIGRTNVRIQSNVRFRRAEILDWIEERSYRPRLMSRRAGERKTQ